MDNRKFNVKIPIWGHSRKHNSFHKTFFKPGYASAVFPQELLFVNTILNQDAEDCTAFSACATRGSMKNKNYDPIQYWAEECAYDGAPTTQDGTSPDTCMETGVETGWVPVGTATPTDRASASFSVTPNNGMDMFDSIRMAIVQTQNPMQGFVVWYADWDNTNQGIVPDAETSILGGHAIKIAGFTTINNIPYLVIQNSWGTTMGLNGLFYFDRATANFAFGAGYVRLWTDSGNVQVQQLGLMAALLQNLLNLKYALSRAGRAFLNLLNK